MNYIDIILALLLAWFAYQGFRKGFVIELASLAALILGVYAAVFLSEYAANFLVRNFDMGPKYVPVVSFIITFVVVVFFVYSIGKLLEKLIDMIALGFINKLVGGVFGLLKGVVLISVVIMIINHFSDDFISSEKRENSMLYDPVEGVAPMLWDHLRDWNLDDGKIKELREDVEQMTV